MGLDGYIQSVEAPTGDAFVPDGSQLDGLESSTESTTVNDRTFVRKYDGTTLTETVITPEGRVTSTVFDEEGRIVEVHRPNEAPTINTYDDDGRLETTTRGDRTWSYEYTDDGHLKSVTQHPQAKSRPSSATRWDGSQKRSSPTTGPSNMPMTPMETRPP